MEQMGDSASYTWWVFFLFFLQFPFHFVHYKTIVAETRKEVNKILPTFKFNLHKILKIQEFL